MDNPPNTASHVKVGDQPIAHTVNGNGERQLLSDHLDNVADLAEIFASSFGAGDAARLLGQWHDLGKYHPDFQQYLRLSEKHPNRKFKSVDHKAAGALLALQLGLDPLALPIQGHHGGLRSRTDLKAWLTDKTVHATEALASAANHNLDLQNKPAYTLPDYILTNLPSAEFYLRMLFSALVDADFLDTEAHFSPDISQLRNNDISIDALWGCFNDSQHALQASSTESPVNKLRTEIYRACVDSAMRPPGLFRMTVPTGGGKTRTGLAFALRHAQQHGMQRVIVAVPFISITTQTAKTYREIFSSFPANPGESSPVLEHHSGATKRLSEPDDYDPSTTRTRLSAENWDAPIIVTTTVQLFESIFANSTSRCRKLHRLANSVIILDEVQTLPVQLLDPILDAIRELTEHYHCSIVLSTATQPSFETLPIFRRVTATEIAPDPVTTFKALQRVQYDWRVDTLMSWAEVAELTNSSPQVMAILNTKKDAIALLDAVTETSVDNDPYIMHLSTLLCGAHRKDVLDQVQTRLQTGQPCTLITTQVVEAGVDLDFPVVLRAMGPLTSIIQAAGRANREGKLDHGRVIIFEPHEGGLPPGTYKRSAQVTQSMLHDGLPDMDDPATTGRYLELLYKLEETDKQSVQKSRNNLDYPETAKRFRMIPDDTADVVVSYGSDAERASVQSLLTDLRSDRINPRIALRRLQPYLVSIRSNQVPGFQKLGLLETNEILPGLYEWHGRYDSVRGLVVEGKDPDKMIW